MAIINLVVDVTGEAAGAPGVSRTFNYAKLLTSPLVTLSLEDDTGVTAYEWTFLDLPVGSSAALSDGSVPSPTFTPDVHGTYLIQCAVNGGESYGRIGVAFTTERRALRKPAAGETTQFDGADGWKNTIDQLYEEVDKVPVEFNDADPVQDLAELRAVTQSERSDKQLRLVEDENSQFRFNLGATVGGEIPDDVDDGRWYQTGLFGGSASGDLSGNYPGPITVTGIQGNDVLVGTPNQDQGLFWNTSNSRFEPSYVPVTIPSIEFTAITNEFGDEQGVEQIGGGIVFDGSNVPSGKTAYFRWVGKLETAATATATVRMYDLGPIAGPPAAPVQRAFATIASGEAGDVIRKQLALNPTSTPGGPPDIYDSARIYEFRMFLSSGAVDDEMQVLWAGIAVE